MLEQEPSRPLCVFSRVKGIPLCFDEELGLNGTLFLGPADAN
jgi:hypothetical protein